MQKKFLPALIAIFLMSGMAAAADLFQEPEILFPEIAAIAIGALLPPKMAWQTNRLRLFLMIGICAVCGVLIVKYCAFPLLLQLLLAFILSQLFLLFSRTGFVPMTSAMVLPVLLGTDTWVYPVSAAVLTACIAASQYLLERRKLRAPNLYTPLPISFRETFLRFSPFYKRILIVALLMLIAVPTGWRFLCAPPLLVAFIELSNPDCPARNSPLKTAAALAACALSGALLRFILCKTLGLPLTAAVGIFSILLVWFLMKTGFYFPPAGAMGILPFLVPETGLLAFSAQAAAGIVLLLSAALFFFRKPVQIVCGDETGTLKRTSASS